MDDFTVVGYDLDIPKSLVHAGGGRYRSDAFVLNEKAVFKRIIVRRK